MNGPKVIVVPHMNMAQHKVFFVQFSNQEKNAQLLKGATLAANMAQATMKVFIVQHMNMADILIMEKNFPKAG
jgi:hypothetical protein